MILLLACASVEDGERDPDRYLRILTDTTSDNHTLMQDCGAILGANLRGDCMFTIARRGTIVNAAVWCPQVEPGIWRDECWFVAAESAAMRGEFDAARQQCMEAGVFAEQCRIHVFQLLVFEEVQPTFSTDRAAAEEHYAGLLASWEVRRAAPALQRMWRDWFTVVGGGVAGCVTVSPAHRGVCEDGTQVEAKTRPGPSGR